MSLSFRLGPFRFGRQEDLPTPPTPPFTVPHPDFERTRIAMEANGRALTEQGRRFVEKANRDFKARSEAVLRQYR
jgi:hypothetical protein